MRANVHQLPKQEKQTPPAAETAAPARLTAEQVHQYLDLSEEMIFSRDAFKEVSRALSYGLFLMAKVAAHNEEVNLLRSLGQPAGELILVPGDGEAHTLSVLAEAAHWMEIYR